MRTAGALGRGERSRLLGLSLPQPRTAQPARLPAPLAPTAKHRQNRSDAEQSPAHGGVELGSSQPAKRRRRKGGPSRSQSVVSTGTALAEANSPVVPPPSSAADISADGEAEVAPSHGTADWKACTVRGLQDGTIVFKFDCMDPLMGEEEPDPDFTWSNAVKLGVKFPQHHRAVVARLERYIRVYRETGAAPPKDNKGLFKTYGKAVRAAQRRRPSDSETEDGSMDLPAEGEEAHVPPLEGAAAAAAAAAASAVAAEVPESQERQHSMHAAASSAAGHAPVVADAAAEGIESSETADELLQDLANASGSSSDEACAPSGMTDSQAAAAHARLSALSAVAAALRGLLAVLATSLAAGGVGLLRGLEGWVLAVYRLLPYCLRSRLFGRHSWPPRVTAAHVSPSLSALLESKEGMDRHSLAAAGIDPQGRSLDPLHDVPRWRLEQLVGCGIGDASIYRSALTHVTALPPERRVASYERLEFLGDSVGELVVREALMDQMPEADEGELTVHTQTVVAGWRMNELATWLGLGRWVLKNSYAMRDSQTSPGVLGDAFEALLGALYLDRGLGAAQGFLLRVLGGCPPSAASAALGGVQGMATDFKGALTRVAHSTKKHPPVYVVSSAQLRPHGDDGSLRKYWIMDVQLEGHSVGVGRSFEKRLAEQIAARQALKAMGHLEEEEQ